MLLMLLGEPEPEIGDIDGGFLDAPETRLLVGSETRLLTANEGRMLESKESRLLR